jgi:hypothetical protein
MLNTMIVIKGSVPAPEYVILAERKFKTALTSSR